jgi:hypothetical protein
MRGATPELKDQPVPDGFVHTSDTNEDWLSPDSLEALPNEQGPA